MIIERLMILHSNYTQLCSANNNITNQVDENSSDDELLDPILYFYSSSRVHSRTPTLFSVVRTNDDMDHRSEEERSYEEEAIQFAGLCTALYSLPHALTSNVTAPTTSEVQLGNCILVFQPLEIQYQSQAAKPSIVAIAQIAKTRRPTQQQYQQSGFAAIGQTTGTPSAVAAAIKRCHDLFCFLRGGGIHERLHMQQQQLSGTENSGAQNQQQYEGQHEEYESNRNSINRSYYRQMSRLLDLRKTRRRLAKQIERREYDDDDADYDEDDDTDDDDDDTSGNGGKHVKTTFDLKEAQKEIEREMHDLYYYQLPMRSLKEELRVHYDTFVEIYTHDGAAASSGVYRNIVETVPPPRPTLAGTHADYSAPTSLSAIHLDVEMELRVTIRKLISSLKQACETPDQPHVLGITSFVNGQMLFPYTHVIQSDDFDNGFPGFDVSNEICIQLMSYLTEFQFHMHQKKEQHPDTINIVGLKSISGKLFGFLEPPPLSFMSSIDDHFDSSFFGPTPTNQVTLPVGFRNEGSDDVDSTPTKVWAPKVWLPYMKNRKCQAHETDDDENEELFSHINTRICLFNHGDFSFLVYLNDVKSEMQNTIFQPVFRKIQEYLVTGLDLILSDEIRTRPKCSIFETIAGFHTRTWNEPGQSILSINRHTQSLILFADPQQQHNNNNRNDMSPIRRRSTILNSHRFQLPERRGMSRLFFNKKPVITTSASNNQLSPSRNRRVTSSLSHSPSNCPVDPLLLGLDCRHKLASQLSLDTLLALEDAMDEIRQHRNTVLHRKGQSRDTIGRHLNNNNNDDDNSDTLVPDGCDTSFEMCTLSPGRWVYAYAEDDTELYVVFDDAYFVTIADVQRGHNGFEVNCWGFDGEDNA